MHIIFELCILLPQHTKETLMWVIKVLFCQRHKILNALKHITVSNQIVTFKILLNHFRE